MQNYWTIGAIVEDQQNQLKLRFYTASVQNLHVGQVLREKKL